ncbi:MAG: hypothetical protein IPM18_05880 [Phycisphaerales bacterium]|nr:hypothetical protein [Phycisphaerales bacterium]
MLNWIGAATRGHTGAAFLGVLTFALTVAPVGCTLEWPLIPGDGRTTVGLFLNTDTAGEPLAAGRVVNGDAFFVYGSRTSAGGIGEVDAILIRTAAGQAEIHFEFGRPVRLLAADGSSVRITYAEAEPLRLTASADVFDAVSGSTETFALQIDLTRTAAEVAAAIERQTGISIPLPDVSSGVAKLLDRSQGAALAVLLLVPIIVLNSVLVTVLGQVLNSMWTVVSTAFRAVLLVAFSPFILFTALLGQVVTNLAQRPLLEIFIELPSRPAQSQARSAPAVRQRRPIAAHLPCTR